MEQLLQNKLSFKFNAWKIISARPSDEHSSAHEEHGFSWFSLILMPR